MTSIHLRKVPQGFVPDTEKDWFESKKFKLGSVVRADVVNPRNLRFFRKWWALIEVGFGLWEEFGVTVEYKGEKVLPDLERFRKDVTILAGFHRPVVNIRGELRMEAESIAFGNMSDERFEDLYNATVHVLLRKVLKGMVSEERLREMADAVLEFA